MRVTVVSTLYVWVQPPEVQEMSGAGEEWTFPPVRGKLRVKRALVLVKVAVAFFAASITIVQLPVPLQAPDQPVKINPLAGLAERVAVVPLLYVRLHVPMEQLRSGVGVE